MPTCVMSGNPNRWAAAGVPATAGLPDNARPGFSINRTCRPSALCTERNSVELSERPGCVRRLETWPRSCWRFDVESIDCPLPMLPNGAGASDQNDAGSETRWRQPPVDGGTVWEVGAAG